MEQSMTPDTGDRRDEAPSLRDMFAMAALTGIYAAHRDTAQAGAGGHVAATAARMAYEAATAMLAERARQAP